MAGGIGPKQKDFCRACQPNLSITLTSEIREGKSQSPLQGLRRHPPDAGTQFQRLLPFSASILVLAETWLEAAKNS